MNNTAAHQKLLNEIWEKVGSLPNVRLWARVVGFDDNRKIKYGVTGETDLQGIIAPQGRMLCIEIKTGTGKLSKGQKTYRDIVTRFGALYIEGRSLEQVLDVLKKENVI